MTPIEARGLVVAIHDVAPRTLDACRSIAARLDGLGVAPLALLVVPRFHGDAPPVRGDETTRWLEGRLARGDEVVLHGLRHVADRRPADLAGRLRARLLTDGEGEFLALEEADAAARLGQGLADLEAAGLPPPRGFVAPAWLLGPPARAAVGRAGFAYTTTHGTLDDLERRLRHRAPVLGLSCRTRLRTLASRAVVPLAGRALSRSPRLRIALHPVDAAAPAALAALLRTMAAARRTRPLVTYGQMLDGCRGYRREEGSSASVGGVSSSDAGAPGIV